MKTQIPSIAHSRVIRILNCLIHSVIFSICLLSSFKATGQRILYKDIVRVVNFDSLENALRPNQPNTYLIQLLVLEKSWLKYHSPKFGTKLNELRALAIKLKRNDALPLQVYYKAKLLIIERKNSEAFQTLMDALHGFENEKDTVGIIKVLGELSTLPNKASSSRFYSPTSFDFAKRNLEIAEKYGDKYYILEALMYLAISYNNQRKTDEVKKIIDKQLKIIGNDKDLQEWKSDVANQLTQFYISEKKYQEAYDNLKQFEELIRISYSTYNYYGYLLKLSDVCILVKRYDEAQKYIEFVQEKVRNKEFELIRLRVYDLNRKLYKQKKDFEKALIYADSLSKLKQEINKNESIEKFNELEVTYKTKELQNQNLALSKENELVKSRNKTIIIAIIGATLSIILLAILLYFLNKSRKKAQLQTEEISKLSQIRDQYIRIIAHDLRSPIYAMQGMYDMVNYAIKTQHFDDLQRISNFIDETGIKTKHLLDNLMNWGMTQQDEVSYDPQKLNVIENLNEVISIYESAKIHKNFTITVNCNAERYVYADKQGFQLILRNLVDNAIKNLPPTNGIIEVLVAADADKNVTIIIQDNGNGIAAEKLATINEVFDNPLMTTMGKNGLGLGITLIGKFVKRNNGFITANSVLNRGSSFTLSLPVSL